MKATLDKSFARRSLHTLAAFLLIFSLVAPVAIAADKKGEKEYKRGLQHEEAQRWEQAVQEFALAVAAKPSNIEYQLHYRRAIFNASQVFMMKGRSLAEREDYVGAYNAFRQSYGYDPVNQLALSEMERMLRLQREKEARNESANGTTASNAGGARTAQAIPAAFVQNGAANGARSGATRTQQLTPSTERLRVLTYSSVDLENLIRQLAADLNLNVIFDEQFSQRKREISLNLRDVTTAQALDYIFQTRNLFFQKLGRRTILVADAQKRTQYQQLQLRTFFLKNTAPEEVQRVLAAAFPAGQGGRAPIQPIPNKATNSLTVRDTPENLRVVEELIRSLDKERAAMVFDVQIYEVSRTDMLQLGGQIGNSGNIGGTSGLLIPFTESDRLISGAASIPTALGAGLILPPIQLSALQDKQNTRLLESTQLHAFDNEDVEQRIGQRVPVQTASYFPFGSNTGGGNTNNPTPGFSSGGFPVVNYEPTGLTIKFTKPQVFPSGDGDYDVQVQMKLESKDVIGGQTATPTFSERSLTGTARIKNNRTLMLASVASNQERRGRTGIPLLGLIPLLGRFISTPTRDNRNRDIVIAITPRVLRAPSITPADELARSVGAQGSPLSDSLEDVVQDAEREEQLARAAKAEAATSQQPQLAAAQPVPSAAIPVPATISPVNTPAMSLPSLASSSERSSAGGVAPEEPTYIPAPRALLPDVSSSASNSTVSSGIASQAVAFNASALPKATTNTTTAPIETPTAGTAKLHFLPNDLRMQKGERRQVVLMLDSEVPISMVVAMLKFDPKIIAVRNVVSGNFASGQNATPVLISSINPQGSVLASLVTPDRTSLLPSGTRVLLILEVEGLASGRSHLDIASEDVQCIAPDNRSITQQPSRGRVVVLN